MKRVFYICIPIVLIFMSLFTIEYYNSFSEGSLEIIDAMDIQQPTQYTTNNSDTGFEDIVKACENHFDKYQSSYKKITHVYDNGIIVHKYLENDVTVKVDILEKDSVSVYTTEVYFLYENTMLYIDPKGSFFVSAPDRMVVLDSELNKFKLSDEEIKAKIRAVISRLEKLNII